MEHIQRDRHLTPEEVAKYDLIRAQVKKEFPPLKPDFTFARVSGMVALTPMSADANKAVDAGLISYEDWQLMGGSIMVDHRMFSDLKQSLENDGFTVNEE